MNNTSPFPSDALRAIHSDVFKEITALETNKILDQLFIESMGSQNYDDCFERQKVVQTYKALKLLLYSVETNSCPSNGLRGGIVVNL
jgi:hypothetical protein